MTAHVTNGRTALMAKKLDPKIAAILKEHGFGPDACWDCHGTWVVYHKVLERIAASAGIVFDAPQLIEANGEKGIAALVVTGSIGDKKMWSIGEAAPKNNKNAYPWAMAEKRAVDRVVLKLIGLHGWAYSEEEADDFKPKSPPGITKFRKETRDFYADLQACSDYDSYVAFATTQPVQDFLTKAQQDFPDEWHGDGEDIKGIKGEMKAVCDRLKKAESGDTGQDGV